MPDLSQAEAELDTGEEPVLEQTTDSSYPDAYVDVEGDGLVGGTCPVHPARPGLGNAARHLVGGCLLETQAAMPRWS